VRAALLAGARAANGSVVDGVVGVGGSGEQSLSEHIAALEGLDALCALDGHMHLSNPRAASSFPAATRAGLRHFAAADEVRAPHRERPRAPRYSRYVLERVSRGIDARFALLKLRVGQFVRDGRVLLAPLQVPVVPAVSCALYTTVCAATAVMTAVSGGKKSDIMHSKAALASERHRSYAAECTMRELCEDLEEKLRRGGA